MSYEFRKLYADVLTPDGTLCVVYLSWVKLLGRWYGRSGVELYAHDGTRTVHLGGEVAPVERDAVDATRIVVPLPGGDLVLRYEPEHEGFSPPPPAACPSLSWEVLVPRGRAHISSAELGEHEGVGYVDWVTISRPTRLLRLRELTWGRAHVADATVAFTALDLADGRTWRAGAVWTKPSRAPVVARDVTTQLDDAGVGQVNAGDASLALRAGRVLHEGDAFGPDRVSKALDRLVVRAIGGSTHETRWVGTATMGGEEGRAVYERVRFGAAAKESLMPRFRPPPIGE